MFLWHVEGALVESCKVKLDLVQSKLCHQGTTIDFCLLMLCVCVCILGKSPFFTVTFEVQSNTSCRCFMGVYLVRFKPLKGRAYAFPQLYFPLGRFFLSMFFSARSSRADFVSQLQQQFMCNHFCLCTLLYL